MSACNDKVTEQINPLVVVGDTPLRTSSALRLSRFTSSGTLAQPHSQQSRRNKAAMLSCRVTSKAAPLRSHHSPPLSRTVARGPSPRPKLTITGLLAVAPTLPRKLGRRGDLLLPTPLVVPE